MIFVTETNHRGTVELGFRRSPCCPIPIPTPRPHTTTRQYDDVLRIGRARSDKQRGWAQICPPSAPLAWTSPAEERLRLDAGRRMSKESLTRDFATSSPCFRF